MIRITTTHRYFLLFHFLYEARIVIYDLNAAREFQLEEWNHVVSYAALLKPAAPKIC